MTDESGNPPTHAGTAFGAMGWQSLLIRCAIVLGILIVGGLAGWFLRGSGGEDVATISVYQDWRLSCPQPSDRKFSCEMSQDVVDGKTHSEVAQLALGVKDDKRLMAVTVPYNVLLDPGIGVQFDSDAVRVYPYETCNRVGCVAMVPVDDKMLSSLSVAKAARILIAGLDRKPVGLPFSLNGYAQAMHAFDKNEAKRHSWWQRLWS